MRSSTLSKTNETGDWMESDQKYSALLLERGALEQLTNDSCSWQEANQLAIKWYISELFSKFQAREKGLGTRFPPLGSLWQFLTCMCLGLYLDILLFIRASCGITNVLFITWASFFAFGFKTQSSRYYACAVIEERRRQLSILAHG